MYCLLTYPAWKIVQCSHNPSRTIIMLHTLSCDDVAPLTGLQHNAYSYHLGILTKKRLPGWLRESNWPAPLQMNNDYGDYKYIHTLKQQQEVKNFENSRCDKETENWKIPYQQTLCIVDFGSSHPLRCVGNRDGGGGSGGEESGIECLYPRPLVHIILCHQVIVSVWRTDIKNILEASHVLSVGNFRTSFQVNYTCSNAGARGSRVNWRGVSSTCLGETLDCKSHAVWEEKCEPPCKVRW